jgi:hypothetical protein
MKKATRSGLETSAARPAATAPSSSDALITDSPGAKVLAESLTENRRRQVARKNALSRWEGEGGQVTPPIFRVK